MKTSHYFYLLAMACLTATALFMGACSDEWDNHYEGKGQESAVDQPSLLELVKADADLSQFLRVLQRTGYDKVLDSPQSLTLFAPVITEAEADSVIALYDAQKREYIIMPDGSQRNMQEKENKAIVQFVQNHIALFEHSVSTEYNDTVRMMNGKYMNLQSDNLNSISFLKKNVPARNGIFYKLPQKEMFFANVRDYLELNPQLTHVAAYYKQFDNYTLDEASSVQRSIVDGKIVYADSVLRLSNTLHSTLGWINSEDSSYLFLAPSDEVWEREYEQFLPYFNYVNAVENRDSVADLNAKFSIIRGRVFNLNEQRSPQDSMVNTLHVNSTALTGLNVYSRPYEQNGMLFGLNPWSCSNGQVCLDTEGRIDHKLTFMEARWIAATDPSVRRMPILMVNSQNQPQVSILNRAMVDTITYNGHKFDFSGFSRGSYMEMRPITYTGTTNTNSAMYFYLTNTMSNVYYNVYLVTVPAFANADGYNVDEVLPTRFQVSYNERLLTDREKGIDNPNDDVSFTNINQERPHSVPEGEEHKNGNNYFQTSGDQIDYICIDKARKPNVSGYNMFGSNNLPAMRYKIISAVRPPDLNNKLQTNVMRIYGLYYIPFTTKEEAEAFDLFSSSITFYDINI